MRFTSPSMTGQDATALFYPLAFVLGGAGIVAAGPPRAGRSNPGCGDTDYPSTRLNRSSNGRIGASESRLSQCRLSEGNPPDLLSGPSVKLSMVAMHVGVTLDPAVPRRTAPVITASMLEQLTTAARQIKNDDLLALAERYTRHIYAELNESSPRASHPAHKETQHEGGKT